VASIAPLLDRELLVFRRIWHAFAFSAFVMPLLFLVAMGVGLGGLVDDRPGSVEGLTYLQFVAPGLMVAAAMQNAAGESLWPVLGGIKWDGRYIAQVASPLSASDVFVGLVAWGAIRATATSTVFLAFAALLGGVPSWWGVLALPATVLTAAAFSAPMAAWAATKDSDAPFAMVMRLGVQPLFLFSGTFFPVSNLPDWVEPLSWANPLWHGAELARHATTGDLQTVDLLHAGLLALCVLAGLAAGARTFTKRLTP
jgi:lipooligosaccharide transport system permease protein